jgi:hypothetical protein
MINGDGAASAANGNARPELTGLGIHLRDYRQGEHRAACPRCAEAKRRSRDTALAVRIDPGGNAVPDYPADPSAMMTR